jgi:hypothetical protein
VCSTSVTKIEHPYIGAHFSYRGRRPGRALEEKNFPTRARFIAARFLFRGFAMTARPSRMRWQCYAAMRRHRKVLALSISSGVTGNVAVRLR